MWPKLKKRIWQWRGVLITAPSVAALVMAASYAGLFQLLELNTLDLFFRLRPLETPDPRIVIVTIGESDISHANKWPLADGSLAKLIEKIKVKQPKAIGLDLYRNLPVEPGHQELEEVFKSTPNLIGVEKVAGERVEPPPILSKLDQVALSDLVIDPDGKIRRGLISVKDNKSTRLSLGANLAMMYLESEGITLRMIDPVKKKFGLGKAVITPFTGNEGGYVRTNAGGYQIILNFRGPESNFETISMTDLLEDRVPIAAIRDRLVFIGATGQSLNDLFFTSYSTKLFGSPKRTPGVLIHANLASQILSSALEGRPQIQFWPAYLENLWIVGWSFIGGIVTLTLFQANYLKKHFFLRWIVHGIWIVITGGIAFGTCYLAFLGSWWIPVVRPLMGFAVSMIAIAGYYSRGLQRQSEKTLIQLLEAMPVGVWVMDSNGNTYYANRTAISLLGKEILTSTKSQLANQHKLYIAGTNQLYPNQNLPIIRALNGEYYSADDLEIRQADKIIPIEGSGTPIFDENGNVSYALVAFQDITQRKKAQVERERLIKELFELNQNLEKSLDAELELTDAYQRFVPHAFLHFLGCESILDVQLGDNVQLDMSILFSDIRDFTKLSEQMTPADNFKFINAYLQRMEPAIAENNGFIDKYIGDAIMALFSGGADDAVKAGIAMLKSLNEYNETRGRPGRPKIRIGIGINTGSLMLGTVGSPSRMNGTVISDAVNLASRIEGLTKNYGVALLISHHTFLLLQDPNDYNIRLIDRVQVKGKSGYVSIFEVFDADLPEIRTGKLKTKVTFEQAVLLASQKQLTEAAKLFQECLVINPHDHVAKIYWERCQQEDGHLFNDE